MDLSSIPKLNLTPTAFMNRADIVKMKERASEHGQCVRQLTVRQQNTKFSAGTLPRVQLQEDPLKMTDVDEEEERAGSEEVLEEYYSDSDVSISLSDLSGDEAEQEAGVGRTLTTRNGRQIKAVVRLGL